MANRKHDQVKDKRTLLRLPEEIIDTYGLFVSKGERKVSLIGRPLPNGTVSLVIYSYQSGRKVQQATGVVLLPEDTQDIKEENKEKIRVQRVRVDELNTKAIKEDVGFKPTKHTRLTLASFIDELIKAHDHQGDHFAASARALKNHIAGYEQSRGKKDTLLSEVSNEWVRDFNQYIRFEAIDTHRKDKEHAPHIKPNTQNNMMVKLSVVLNEAARQGKTSFNPVANLPKNERPKKENDNRTFLTIDEVKRLMDTPYPLLKGGKDVGNAFMFSVFSGLRFSDVKRLKGENIYKEGDKVFINFKTKKTDTRQNLKLGNMALRFLPKDIKQGQPVYDLPTNEQTNIDLKKWVKAAGITKKVTFHVSRHTAATLLLNSGASLATVAFQLGHKDVRMTQIYAKITNRSQEAAVDGLDKEFE
jgi:integrase